VLLFAGFDKNGRPNISFSSAKDSLDLWCPLSLAVFQDFRIADRRRQTAYNSGLCLCKYARPTQVRVTLPRIGKRAKIAGRIHLQKEKALWIAPQGSDSFLRVQPRKLSSGLAQFT